MIGDRTAIRPDALEVAVGTMLGRDLIVDPLSAEPREPTRAAFERVVQRALERSPCLVSFSGGRDSSAVLAIAVHVARREGLPEPVPVTLAYEQPESDERAWQEVVVRHLDVRQWERIPAGPELDAVGPVAMRVLRRHGLLFPANAFLHEPMLAMAGGGSMLCGIGGDELFGSPAPAPLRVLAGYERPSRRMLRDAWRQTAPGRRTAAAANLAGEHWLLPDARRTAIRRAAAAEAALGLRWGPGLRRWVADRYYLACVGSIVEVGRHHDVEVVVPFFDHEVMRAVAADGGWSGLRSRSHALESLVGDLLPVEVLHRSTKAVFTRALRGEATEAVLGRWTGGGVDPDLVDADSLRTVWMSAAPDARATLLLQQVALRVTPPDP